MFAKCKLEPLTVRPGISTMPSRLNNGTVFGSTYELGAAAVAE